MENLRRDKKPQASSNQIIHYEEKIAEYKVLPSLSLILSRTTCLEPSGVNYHHYYSRKHLESTPSFDFGLFLSLHKKNLGFYPNKLDMKAIWEIGWRTQWINPFETKDFSLKNLFSIQTHKFSHKTNTPQYCKRNLKLKNLGFFLSWLSTLHLERGPKY